MTDEAKTLAEKWRKAACAIRERNAKRWPSPADPSRGSATCAAAEASACRLEDCAHDLDAQQAGQEQRLQAARAAAFVAWLAFAAHEHSDHTKTDGDRCFWCDQLGALRRVMEDRKLAVCAIEAETTGARP